MSDDLINKVAAAIQRDKAARAVFDKADKEQREAGDEVQKAWTDLRRFQDEQVISALAAQPKEPPQ